MPKPPSKHGSPDDFQTPAAALIPLLPHINKDWVVWECAEGKGNLTQALRGWGYKVIGSDIEGGFDFRVWQPEKWDVVITNPPYSAKEEFLERAYELRKPFAFLLPLTTLESQRRQKLFREFGLEVILFDERIDFETPGGEKGSSWFATAWFTNWLEIGRELTFTHYKREKIYKSSFKRLIVRGGR